MESVKRDRGDEEDKLILKLSDLLRTSERESYTFIELLSDFGGFNDGISLLPAILMTLYN